MAALEWLSNQLQVVADLVSQVLQIGCGRLSIPIDVSVVFPNVFLKSIGVCFVDEAGEGFDEGDLADIEQPLLLADEFKPDAFPSVCGVSIGEPDGHVPFVVDLREDGIPDVDEAEVKASHHLKEDVAFLAGSLLDHCALSFSSLSFAQGHVPSPRRAGQAVCAMHAEGTRAADQTVRKAKEPRFFLALDAICSRRRCLAEHFLQAVAAVAVAQVDLPGTAPQDVDVLHAGCLAQERGHARGGDVRLAPLSPVPVVRDRHAGERVVVAVLCPFRRFDFLSQAGDAPEVHQLAGFLEVVVVEEDLPRRFGAAVPMAVYALDASILPLVRDDAIRAHSEPLSRRFSFAQDTLSLLRADIGAPCVRRTQVRRLACS